MATISQILERILRLKAIAVIRMADTAKLTQVIEAVRSGGVECIEITMTVPNALKVIETVSRDLGDQALIGAGTILNRDQARQAIEAGAEFIVGPTLNLDVIEVAHKFGKPVMPGAFSPTEIVAGWQAGADVVKLFPATVLGPRYLKDVQGPLPDVRLCPTGGVTVDNAGDWIRAGAACVGIGSNLIDKEAIAADRFDLLTERARRLVSNLALDSERVT